MPEADDVPRPLSSGDEPACGEEQEETVITATATQGNTSPLTTNFRFMTIPIQMSDRERRR